MFEKFSSSNPVKSSINKKFPIRKNRFIYLHRQLEIIKITKIQPISEIDLKNKKRKRKGKMKLEGINGNGSGNILSLTIKSTEQQIKVEPKHDDELEEMDDEMLGNVEKDVEDSMPEQENGKKKGPRKKRSLNWEEAERSLLLEVIKPKVEFVENRSVDAKSIKSKRLAWMQITKQFNALNFRHRSLEQIQVQWRAMKNSAKREHHVKYEKAETLEGMDMIEFMEEMQKDSVNGRGQGRGGGGAVIKKEIIDSDEEDTPLASLPAASINSSVLNNNSDDTLQSSTMALPASPRSIGDDANAINMNAGATTNAIAVVASAQPQHTNATTITTAATTTTRQRKKPTQNANAHAAAANSGNQKGAGVLNCSSSSSVGSGIGAAAAAISSAGGTKTKKQRMQQAADTATTASTNQFEFAFGTHSPPNAANSLFGVSTNVLNLLDDKYIRQLFEIVKRQRFAEMDNARRESDHRMRLSQSDQEFRHALERQREEQRMRLEREEYEDRLRKNQIEHEARLLAIAGRAVRPSSVTQNISNVNTNANSNSNAKTNVKTNANINTNISSNSNSNQTATLHE